MATYVNDLRLKEIGTGESAGTWGTETNVNLELIGEALSFGTESITTNADTHTSTVADGSTDPARSMFIKYTGTLDSACTITIAPNTLSRVHLIENGTSGSQNIIISQGSGANVTIPPGDVKAVYLDGAGSGAAVVDAFASLNVVDLKVEDDLTVTDDLIVNGDIDLEGSIDVNGTANLDVVDIDGAVDMASTLQVDGAITSSSGATITVADNSNALTLISTDADASVGPGLDLYRNSSSPADNDVLGTIFFHGEDGAGNKTEYARIETTTKDVSNGAEVGTLTIFTNNADTLTNNRFESNGSEIVINETSGNFDFRVESDGNANAIFVNAGDDRVTFFNSTTVNTSSGTTDGASHYSDGRTDISRASGQPLNLRRRTDGGVITAYYSESSGSITNVANFSVTTAGNFALDTPNGDFTINENSTDSDFRVETNGEANAFVVNSSTNRVGIGTNSPSTGLGVAAVLCLEPATMGSISASQSRPNLARNADGELRIAAGKDANGFITFHVTPSGSTDVAERFRIADNINFEGRAGTSPIFNLVNNDNEDTDTGRETTIRFNGHRSGGEDVINGQISGHHHGSADDDDGMMMFSVNTGSAVVEHLRLTPFNVVVNDASNDHDFRVESDADSNFLFCDSGTGGVRIHTSAPVFSSAEVFTVQAGGGAGIGIATTSSTAGCIGMTASGTASTRFLVRFDSGSGNVGTITHNGSNTSYNTSSDERLKENIKDADDAGQLIDSIQVRQFDWKVDGEHQRYGMIAQELNTVAPEACAFSSDPEEMAGVDYSRLVPMLIKEIQSLRNRLAKLEGE